MSATIEVKQEHAVDEVEFSTFYVGGQLMGVDIRRIQEINRNLDITNVPDASECVRGVINLRGEVATVVDLSQILGIGPTEITPDSRNVIVDADGEPIGLLVSSVSDVVSAKTSAIEPPPPNVSGLDGRFFQGVYKLESELLVILDVAAVLAAEGSDRTRAVD